MWEPSSVKGPFIESGDVEARSSRVSNMESITVPESLKSSSGWRPWTMLSRDCKALLQMPGCESLLSRMISKTPVSPMPTIFGSGGRRDSSGLKSDEESPQVAAPPEAPPPPPALVSSTSFHAAADCSWRMAA